MKIPTLKSPEARESSPSITVLFGRAFTMGGIVAMLVVSMVIVLLERFVASKPQLLPHGEALSRAHLCMLDYLSCSA